MNSKRFALAVVALFVATFATDYLVHGLWLEGDYTHTLDLWRADPEILLHYPWLVGSQLLVAILMAGFWAMAFASGATLRRAILFGLMAGLLRQAVTLTNFAVQPIPAGLALKFFGSGIAQSVLLALIVFAIYKPRAASSVASESAHARSERLWIAASLLFVVLIGVLLLRKSGERDLWAETVALLAPQPPAAAHQNPSPTNMAILFSPLDTRGGKGTPESKAALIEELVRLDTRVRERIRLFDKELKPLLDTIVKRQLKGKDTSYSMQIYREIRWWVTFTSDTNTTHARIIELKKSLESGRSQSFALEQLPDGSWGPGYSAWFMKLYGTVHDGLGINAEQEYPLTFLDRINSPEKLTNYLHSLVLDNFLATGVLNRMELDEVTSNLGRMILGEFEVNYQFHPQLKETFLKFLDDWQNPETGCWGNWIAGPDGTVWRADDVAMTFHIVAMLEDKTQHLDKIARRVLELSPFDFPSGIRVNGHYENHANWDAVFVWRHAWPHMDAETRAAVRAEIARMLQWCLAESLQSDGSFKLSELDPTFGDAMDFGVFFLRDTGFFEKKRRFWTDEEFPQAKEIHGRIKARLESTGCPTPELKRTYRNLNRIYPD